MDVVLAGVNVGARRPDRGMSPNVGHDVRSGGPRDARTRVEEAVPDLSRPEFVAPDTRHIHKVGQAENRVDGQLSR